MMPTINSYYRHYKGGLYRVDAIALHTETEEQMVIYANKFGDTFARPLTMWNERVGERPRFAIAEEQGCIHFEFERERIK